MGRPSSRSSRRQRFSATTERLRMRRFSSRHSDCSYGPCGPESRRYVAALRAGATKKAFVHRSVRSGTPMEVDFGGS